MPKRYLFTWRTNGGRQAVDVYHILFGQYRWGRPGILGARGGRQLFEGVRKVSRGLYEISEDYRKRVEDSLRMLGVRQYSFWEVR